MFLQHGGETLALQPAEMVDVAADAPQKRTVDLVRLIGGTDVKVEFVARFGTGGIQPRQGGGEDAVVDSVVSATGPGQAVDLFDDGNDRQDEGLSGGIDEGLIRQLLNLLEEAAQLFVRFAQ